MANYFLATNYERLDIPAVLGRVSFFHGLAPAQRQRIAAVTQPRKLLKGETLFRKGEMPQNLFIVVFGQIKEAVRSSQGDEKIIEIIGPNQSCGETAMLLDCPYPFFVEALQDTLLLCVAKEMVLDLLETDTAFARRMVAGLSMRLHSLVGDIESYTLQTPEQRFIGYLIQHCYQEAHSGINLKISLPAAKLAIASRLGMTAETLSRILGFFAEAGLIRVDGKHLSIPDLKRLEKYVH